MFYFTDDKVTQFLINAKERGVDVRVILDASSALSKYSKHKILRIAGIPVKVENWPGKMHMKCMITEDYVVTGSLNWTKRAQNFNDENSLIIFNPQIANIYKKNFIKLYNNIPNKWLYEDPKPESKDSPYSCSDGKDNDHDGFIDMDDLDCNPNAKQEGKPFSNYYEKLE